MMTERELEERSKDAHNYEARQAFEVEQLRTEYVGSLRSGNRIYDYFEDTSGGMWYKTRFVKESGIVSEHEFIFGRKEKIRPENM